MTTAGLAWFRIGLRRRRRSLLVLALLIVPVALLAVNLLAAWPGRRAASLRVGHVSRAQ